jgi:hypothetical protein
VERSLETLPIVQPSPPGPEVNQDDDREDSNLLHDINGDPAHITPYARKRPMTKIWYGRFKLRYKNVDAIDYYEEKLRRLDEQIKALRKKDFEATPLAFVTMDSVASAVSNSCSVQNFQYLMQVFICLANGYSSRARSFSTAAASKQ